MTGNINGLSATPSNFGGNPNRPVEKVSWNDVQVFLDRLNERERNAGRLPVRWEYVPPTEASAREYACRAPPLILGEMQSVRKMLTTQPVDILKLVMWANTLPIHGAFLICMGMSLNGL